MDFNLAPPPTQAEMLVAELATLAVGQESRSGKSSVIANADGDSATESAAD
jgi:hypothetical protein